ncbi:MAG: hypothetical protein ACXVZX_07785 [Terriglobales bacterium]
MPIAAQDYDTEHLIRFLKEEFERIIMRCGLACGENLRRRIDAFISFHEFLCREYSRILEEGILAVAIGEFRKRLQPTNFTDQKIIDSLIWKTADLLNKGALVNRQMSYC